MTIDDLILKIGYPALFILMGIMIGGIIWNEDKSRR